MPQLQEPVLVSSWLVQSQQYSKIHTGKAKQLVAPTPALVSKIGLTDCIRLLSQGPAAQRPWYHIQRLHTLSSQVVVMCLIDRLSALMGFQCMPLLAQAPVLSGKSG